MARTCGRSWRRRSRRGRRRGEGRAGHPEEISNGNAVDVRLRRDGRHPLYQQGAPYPEQETEQLAYNVAARRNPHTGAVENLEVLFFTRWLLKGGERQFGGLGELFAEPGVY